MNLKSIAVSIAIITNSYAVTVDATDVDTVAAMNIEIELPDLEVSPYHRPYVALWLETLERKPLATLALWYQVEGRNGGEGSGEKWLKDIRQWWRKTGRSMDDSIDGVTGATRKPDVYSLTWNGLDNLGNPIPAGKYLLNVEASRENGGREYKRQEITLGEDNQVTLSGKSELGDIQITTYSQ